MYSGHSLEHDRIGDETVAEDAKKDLEEEKEEKAEDVTEGQEEEAKEEPLQEEEEKEAASEEAKEGNKRFGKKKDKHLEKLEQKLAELEDKRVRQLAEFENFRKRSEKEKSQMFEIGAKTVVEKLLPVIDNFERGLDGIKEEEKQEPFVQGMELIYKQLLTAFNELGVTAIEAVGQEFDPNLHNAVMMVDDDSVESGKVAEELQKGYMYRESVVRHSMVKVAN